MFVAACARECVCIVGLGSRMHIATPHMHPALNKPEELTSASNRQGRDAACAERSSPRRARARFAARSIASAGAAVYPDPRCDAVAFMI